ncbi:hypothetical protein [Endozoicomonas sp. 8E]|uniref:hypothetical protein n=1 Tax=Endozoicomonas sp. 8E TaxID=3035692 RepID=UPI002938D656|nr:hypothetical protein [Endozoicomonas sp. 8E]WOG29782.1 hypothetical protein P6910_09030 [Endozoicomonas sp. 8E]
MNSLPEMHLQFNPASIQSESTVAKESGANKVSSDQSYQTQVETKLLSERKVDSANDFRFLNEEHYVIKWYLEEHYAEKLYVKKNSGVKKMHVFPFSLNGVKHYRLSPDYPVSEKDFSVSLPLSEEVNLDLCYREQVKKRLSDIFTQGFENVCKTFYFFEDEESVVSGFCHQFVNYLAFGMDKQISQNFNGWYEKLSFVSIQKFDQEKVRWGDIVQLLSGESLLHSLFYIGDGRYISKHGVCDIFFQSLSAAQESYPSDSVRIVRLAPEYYSKQITFEGND